MCAETSPKPQANKTDVSPAVQQGEGNDDGAEAQSPMARLRIDMDSETGLRVVDSGLGHLLNGREIQLAEGPVVGNIAGAPSWVSNIRSS